MTNTKTTKIEVLRTMAENMEIMNNEVFAEYINHEIELLENAAEAKMRKRMEEANSKDLGLKSAIVSILESAEEPMTIKEMIMTGSLPLGISTQKMVAVLKTMSNVERTLDKKSAKFSLR